ncbi:NUDIX domain-containing protein [Marinilactibacillus sp. 15R]|uniref:NUDIX domain-containing protein n=1 Tax=Marinilactibacillus sp. 15R TaxID=1911586 RepID=UPI003FA5B3A6
MLVSNEDDGTVTLSGGEVKTGETTDEAIIREFKEESGLDDVKVIKLIAVIENFLKYKDLDYHQFIYVYSLDLKNQSLNLPTLTREEKMFTKWVDVTSLNSINFRPSIINEILLNYTKNRNPEILHIVNRQD